MSKLTNYHHEGFVLIIIDNNAKYTAHSNKYSHAPHTINTADSYILCTSSGYILAIIKIIL